MYVLVRYVSNALLFLLGFMWDFYTDEEYYFRLLHIPQYYHYIVTLTRAVVCKGPCACTYAKRNKVSMVFQKNI